MFRMYASNSHSYTHLILALGIVRKPTVWLFITLKYPGIHDTGLAAMLQVDTIKLRILVHVCAGMFYLHHDVQVLHKDIKTANILLDGDGHRWKICDFGESKVLAASGTFLPVRQRHDLRTKTRNDPCLA